MDTRTAQRGDMAFRPEIFFLGRTEGAGIVRDPFGRIVRRCIIATQGMPHTAYDAIEFEETFSYDDGEVDTWRWVMSEASEGRYVAAEATAGPGIVGERAGGELRLSFKRPAGKARGLATPGFATRFTLLAPDVALKSVTVRLWGAKVANLTAYHRRIGPA